MKKDCSLYRLMTSKQIPADANVAHLSFILGELVTMLDVAAGRPANYQPIIVSDLYNCKIEYQSRFGWRYLRPGGVWSRRSKREELVAIAIYKDYASN